MTSREETESRLGGGAPRGLTDRERRVCELLLQGVSNKEVAAMMTLSTRTVEFHIANIRKKLGASSKTALVGYLNSRGLP